MNNGIISVLLVEDNPGDARLLEMMLEKTAPGLFASIQVERLSQALNRLDLGGVDVVLLDLSLPDSHGFETFAKVNARAPDVPILILTGLDDEAMATQAVQEGAQDYLVKGQVDRRLIVRCIRYAIERKRAQPDKEVLVARLQEALAKVKTLSGFLPICASCKKIRDDAGYWDQIESYVQKHSEAEFSHGICPDCARDLYPNLDCVNP